jgi:hypothetical protein
MCSLLFIILFEIRLYRPTKKFAFCLDDILLRIMALREFQIEILNNSISAAQLTRFTYAFLYYSIVIDGFILCK